MQAVLTYMRLHVVKSPLRNVQLLISFFPAFFLQVTAAVKTKHQMTLWFRADNKGLLRGARKMNAGQGSARGSWLKEENSQIFTFTIRVRSCELMVAAQEWNQEFQQVQKSQQRMNGKTKWRTLILLCAWIPRTKRKNLLSVQPRKAPTEQLLTTKCHKSCSLSVPWSQSIWWSSFWRRWPVQLKGDR